MVNAFGIDADSPTSHKRGGPSAESSSVKSRELWRWTSSAALRHPPNFGPAFLLSFSPHWQSTAKRCVCDSQVNWRRSAISLDGDA